MDSKLRKKLDAIGNYKNFDAQLAIIESITNAVNMTVFLNEAPECNASLSKSKTGLELVVEGVLEVPDAEKGIRIHIDGEAILMYCYDLPAIEKKLFEVISITHRFDVKRMQSEGFFCNTPDIFRCYFPSDIRQLNTIIFILETLHYQTDTTLYSYDCIRINVLGIHYDIVQVKQNGKGYYVFENLDPVSLESFKHTCYAIQQAVGFLTGYMPGGEEYIFRGTKFSYTAKVRPAMKSVYNPVNTNAYSRLHERRDDAEKYHGKLTKIPASVASALIGLLCTNADLSATIILMMEASSVRSLLLFPSAFSVIIESLSKIVTVPQSGHYSPIGNRELERTITSGLQAYLDSYEQVLSPSALLTLKRRIGGINRPIVLQHLTNNEKLTQPFEQLGIALSLSDIKAIEHRNDLLHGNILLTDGLELPDEQVNAYMAYVSGKLYTLISKLVLKYVGYEGYIINYAKFWGERFAEDEDFYDFI